MNYFRAAIIIPALIYPSEQVSRLLPQLTKEDQLIVVISSQSYEREHNNNTKNISIVIENEVSGAGHARNVGVRSLKGKPRALLFCDGDDCVESNWVSNLLAPLLKRSADIVSGPLIISNLKGEKKQVTPEIDFWYRQAVFGSNMGLTFEAWQKLGGFDDSLRYCEDTDIAWRSKSLDLNIQITENALVYYTLKPRFKEFVQRFQWGRASVKLLHKHGVPLSHLPKLSVLIAHKRASGFASNPILAAVAQWIGQNVGMLIIELGKIAFIRENPGKNRLVNG